LKQETRSAQLKIMLAGLKRRSITVFGGLEVYPLENRMLLPACLQRLRTRFHPYFLIKQS
jgi:hypothetical protein